MHPEGDDETELLKQCRGLVGLFTGSTQMAEELHDVQEAKQFSDKKQGMRPKEILKVIQDVVTRWWSTYRMICRLLILRQFFAMLVRDGKLAAADVPSREGWKTLEELKFLLEPLAKAQVLLEGQTYATLSFVHPMLMKIHLNLELSSVANVFNPSVTECAERMVAKFEQRFGDLSAPFQDKVPRSGPNTRQFGLNKAVLFAYVLDPRHKHLELSHIKPSHQAKISDGLLKKMVENEKTFRKKNAALLDVVQSAAPVASPPRKKRRSGADDDSDEDDNDAEDDDDARFAAYNRAAAKSAPQNTLDELKIQQTCERELALYLPCAGIRKKIMVNGKPVHNDPFAWWKGSCGEFPILWRLAQVYLAIPATSAPSERAFSHAGNTVSADRSRLGDELVTDIIMVKLNHGVEECFDSTSMVYAKA